MPEVGKLSVKIETTGKEQAKNDISDVSNTAKKSSSDLSKTLSKFGSGALKVGKTVAVGIGACATAIGGLTGVAVNAYGNYEQLVGGVETLFKNSSDIVMQYAKNAYETAGMSANEYMTTVTAFTASLLQGLNGDTAKTAEVANMAVTDMADNANKMGTAMESIQNAYQGFSKQNYTMLDNLKLGYGGTKSEMERLLVDAEKISGIHYDISNLADVYNAIHVIQTELGITGTTALEASTTIQGSMNMVKGAWTNLMTGMTDSEQDITGLVDTFTSALDTMLKNVTPKIEQVFKTIPNVMTKLIPTLITMIIGFLPTLIEAVGNLIEGLVTAIPDMLQKIADVLPQLGAMILQVLPRIAETFGGLFGMMLNAFETGFPSLVTYMGEGISRLGDKIKENMPEVISKGLDIILGLSQMLLENLPQLVARGMDFIMSIVQGIIASLPDLIAKVPVIVANFCNTFNESMTVIFMKGAEILWEIIKGIISAVPDLIANLPQIVNAIFAFWQSINWFNLGKNLIDGIKNGIKNMGGSLIDTAKNLFNNLQNNIYNIFERIKTIITNPILTAKTKVLALIGEMSNGAVNVFNSLKGTVSGIFEGVKNAIVNPINTAKDLISGIVNTIKGFFSGLKITIPHIPLPHFSIQPYGWSIGDLLKGRLPSLGINWYAKAVDQPMLLDGATIFGAKDGNLLGGGETKPEVVYGRDNLLNDIRQATAENRLSEELLQKLYDLLLTMSKKMNRPIVLDSGAIVGYMLDDIDSGLGDMASLKLRGVK